MQISLADEASQIAAAEAHTLEGDSLIDDGPDAAIDQLETGIDARHVVYIAGHQCFEFDILGWQPGLTGKQLGEIDGISSGS